MKIVYLVASKGITFNQKGGAGTHIRGTINALNNAHFEVYPILHGDYYAKEIVLRKNNNEYKNKNWKNELIIKFKTFTPKLFLNILRDIKILFSDFYFFFKAFKKIKNINPDVIYERSCYLSISGILISKILRIPIFIENSGCLVEIFSDTYGRGIKNTANYIERIKLNSSNLVVAESYSSIPYLKSKFKLKNIRVIAKPLGINNNKGIIYKEIQEKLITKLNFSDNDFVIAFVGTFTTYQKVDFLLEYFKKIKNPNIKLLLIGGGGNYLELINYKKKHQIKNVFFTGYVESHLIPTYLSIAQVGILPNSEQYLLPIKIYEYGLHNLCPIVPNFPCAKEIIDNEAGWTFTPLNGLELINTIQHAFEKRKITQKYAQNWSQYVLSNYTWEATIKDLKANFELFKKNDKRTAYQRKY